MSTRINPRDPMEERIGRRKLLDAIAVVTAERDQARQMLANADQEVSEWNPLYGRLSQERDHLRIMLADAPHDSACNSPTWPCDCWKAGL